MASIPQKIEKFSDLQKDFGTSISESLWIKMAQLQNYVNLSFPVGMLMFFEQTQSNLPSPPDSNYWKYCDGTAVTNINSPLLGVVVPDLRGKFWRAAGSTDILLSTGGANTGNFAHNHGGFSGFTYPFGTINLDNGGERVSPDNHRHTIGTSLGISSIVPPYHEVQVYVRVV